MKHEKYRVRPGLSISSAELYRRYRNNTLQVQSPDDLQFSLDSKLQDFTRMSKGAQLAALKENADTIIELKSKLTNAGTRRSD